MEIDYETLMEGKSEEGLRKYITEAKKYKPEAVNAATKELEKRGLVATNEDINLISTTSEPVADTDVQAPQTKHKKRNKIVHDLNAPLYYSEGAIGSFSIFFGTLAGSLLLYHNIRRSDNKNGASQVLLFGIFYTILGGLLINLFKPVTIGFTLNILGGLILIKYFWKKNLGEGMEYRAKRIWGPLIIWIAIAALFITIHILSYPPNQ